jgi:23S rRNA (guanosine2251-2'-O)-methyltransferase
MSKKHSDASILWGIHAVVSALKNPQRKVEKILVTQDAVAQKIGRPCIHVTATELKRYVPDTAVHQGVVAFVSPLEPLSLEDLDPDKGLVLALDEVVDPHNVGALWRSAAAFGAQALILTKHNSPPIDGSVAKSACGAMDCIPYVRVTNLTQALNTLKEKNFFIVGLAEEGAVPLRQSALWPLVLVVGAEGKGLRRLTQAQCDQILSIECAPSFQTLNASVAGALALDHFYHVGRQAS